MGVMKALLELLADRVSFYGTCFLAVFLGIYNCFTSAALGCLALGVVLSAFIRPQSVFRRELLIPALFWCLCCVSVLHSPMAAQSSPGLKKLIWAIVIVPGIACAFTSNRRLKFIAILTSGVVVLFLIDAVYQAITGQDFFSSRPVMRYETSFLARLTGPFLQAALLGLFLAVGIPLLEAGRRSAREHTWMRRGWGVLVAAALLVLGGTFTLGAWIGVLVAWIAMNIVDRRGSWIPVTFLAAGLALAFIPNACLAGAQETLFTNLLHRMKMWEIAGGLWAQRPFLGWGLNTFGTLYQNAATPGDPFFGMGAPHAHNMYIHLLVETGLWGFIAFLTLLVATGKKLLTMIRLGENATLALGLWGGLIAYSVHGLLESNLQTSQGNLLFWSLVGFALLKRPLQKG
jgi:O-antigen ligase